MHTRTHTRTYTHTYTHIHTHPHPHTHIHTRTEFTGPTNPESFRLQRERPHKVGQGRISEYTHRRAYDIPPAHTQDAKATQKTYEQRTEDRGRVAVGGEGESERAVGEIVSE